MTLTILSNKEQQIEAMKQIVARAAEMSAMDIGVLSENRNTMDAQDRALDWLGATT